MDGINAIMEGAARTAMSVITDNASPSVASSDEYRAAKLRTWVGQSSAIKSGYGLLKRSSRPFYRSGLVPLFDRRELPLFFNSRGLCGCGVEVGVQAGLFSEALLSCWHGKHLISVDPWRTAESNYHDSANVPQTTHDANYRETVRRLSPFGERSTIWRMYGDEAAARIPHHSMDFVYLDARHDYDSVMSDITIWIDKVRPGGVLCGHDYMDALVTYGELGDNYGDFGVKKAVDNFFAARHETVKATLLDPPWRSWYVVL